MTTHDNYEYHVELKALGMDRAEFVLAAIGGGKVKLTLPVTDWVSMGRPGELWIKTAWPGEDYGPTVTPPATTGVAWEAEPF